MKLSSLIYLIVLPFLLIHYRIKTTTKKQVIILIHGTWANKEEWHMPGGDFFESLKKNIDPSTALVSFLWSGSLGHESRLHGAKALALLIESYDPETQIILIGHSYGGVVAILASQLLAQNPYNTHTINELYSLGAPLSNSSYIPDMSVVNRVYNFFSFQDLVQPLFGIAQREFTPHERIVNACVTINGKSPDHSNLHHEIIGEWLLHVQNCIPDNLYCVPGIIHFSDNNPPIHEIDTKRNSELELDRYLNQMIVAAFRSYAPDAQLDQESHLQNDMNQLLQKLSPILLLR